MTIAAIIAIILIFVCIRIFSNDTNEKPKGNPSFHKDNFDKEVWKNYMRIIPIVLYAIAKGNPRKNHEMWGMVSEVSALTHAHPRSRIACEMYATILKCIIENPSKRSVGKGIYLYRKWNEEGSAEFEHFKRIDKDILENLSRDEIKSTGYVVDTLEAALWCLLTTDSYKNCVLKAVNLGDDTDTVAAVAGGLAGALYGLDSIPTEWLDKLQRRDYIEDMCERAARAW